MKYLERILLGIIILEIPLQVDSYLYFQEQAATYGAVDGINISVTTFCLLALYVLWAFDAATLKVRRSSSWSFSLPLAIYIGAVGFSVLVAEQKLYAIAYLNLLMQAFMLFLYVANRLREKKDVVFITSMLAVSLALQGCIIVGSWFVESRLIGSPLSIGPVQVSVWPRGRFCGTLSTPVSAGSYLALLLLPVGSLLLTPVERRVKMLSLFAVCVGTLAICLTQSRGSLIAVFIALFVFGVLHWRRGWLPRWTPAMAGVLAVIAAYPLLITFENRAVGSDEGSAASRIHLAKTAWNLIKDQPFAGVGAGNYHVAAEPYANASPFRSEWFYTVHNAYLLEWAEGGLLGVSTFVVFLLSIVYLGWTIWQVRDPFLSPLALAIAATVLGQMVHMAVDMFNSRPYIETLWCCAAIVFALKRLAVTSESAAVQADDIRPLNPQMLSGAACRLPFAPPSTPS